MGAGSSVPTSFEYYGGLVIVICAGEITRLTRIANGDTVIWTGDVDQTSRDSDGKTALATSIGTGYLYWGRADENPNADLAAALVDYGTGATTVPIPAWRRWAKIIFKEANLGTQPTPPTLTFDFERRLDLLALSEHDISGDAVLPEVVYDLLTNAVYSVGADPALLDTASFVAAAEQLISEGLGASPQIDQPTTLRDFIGTLQSYDDSALRWENGRVKYVLLRANDSVPVAIDESAMTAEPQISSDAMESTWNFTRLVFSDRANNWDENAVEPYDESANAEVRGENVPKDIEMPFITRRSVAKMLARRKGVSGGVPQAKYTIRLLPSFGRLQPGDLLALSYAKFGLVSKVLRVANVSVNGSENSEVTIEAYTEALRDESHDYSPPDDPIFNIGSYYDESGGAFGTLAGASAYLLGLPPDLQQQGDGFLVAFSRPNASITKRKIWWTWDPAQKPYKQLDKDKTFPTGLTLLAWTRASNNTTWMLRVQFGSQDDADYITELMDDGKDVYFVTAERLWQTFGSTQDQHQAFGLWLQAVQGGNYTVISPLVYDIEVSDSAFGSDPPTLETASLPGKYPCSVLFAGKKDEFFIKAGSSIHFSANIGNGSNFWSGGVLHNTDVDLTRYFKVAFGTAQETQDIADVTASTFDRDDPTMCPDGTLSIKWGSRVPTLYEQYDRAAIADAFGLASQYDSIISDLDIDLYSSAFGSANTSQQFAIEATDQVLGVMCQTGQTYYNNQP